MVLHDDRATDVDDASSRLHRQLEFPLGGQWSLRIRENEPGSRNQSVILATDDVHRALVELVALEPVRKVRRWRPTLLDNRSEPQAIHGFLRGARGRLIHLDW